VFTAWLQQAFRAHHLHAGSVPEPRTGLLSMSSQWATVKYTKMPFQKDKTVRVGEYKGQQSTVARGVLSTLGCRGNFQRRGDV